MGILNSKWLRVLVAIFAMLSFTVIWTGCNDDDDNDNDNTLSAVLRGSQEVPPVTTDAEGTGTAVITDNSTSIDVTLNTTGNFTSAVTLAHIHVGQVGEDGPIIFNLFTGGTFPSTLTVTLTSANLIPQPAEGINTFSDAVNAMMNGETYFNVHTVLNPDGEIRGQIGPATMVASLDGAQVVPTVATATTGNATVQFNNDQSQVKVTMSLDGINNISSSTLNLGPSGENGLPIFNLFGSGSFSGEKTKTVTSSNLIEQSSEGINDFDDAVNAILSQQTYIIVNTQALPNGQIRGDIVPPLL